MLVNLRYFLLLTATLPGYGIFYECDTEIGTFLVEVFYTAQEAIDWFTDQYPNTELNVRIERHAQTNH